MPITHQLLAVFVALIWGTNFVFIELGLNDLPPFLFAGLRFTFAALPLVFILPRPAVPWRYLIAYGFFIGFGQFGLLFWVMGSHMSPGLASLVIQVQAVFTIMLALMLFKETIRMLQILSLVISFAGILLIAVQGDTDATPIGLTIILIAALSWAAGNLVVKRSGKVHYCFFSMVLSICSSSTGSHVVLLRRACSHRPKPSFCTLASLEYCVVANYR